MTTTSSMLIPASVNTYDGICLDARLRRFLKPRSRWFGIAALVQCSLRVYGSLDIGRRERIWCVSQYFDPVAMAEIASQSSITR